MGRKAVEFLKELDSKHIWMEEHGYNLLGGIYDIRISLVEHPSNKGESVVHKSMISAEKVYDMTIDELEVYDCNVWLSARHQMVELIKATRK